MKSAVIDGEVVIPAANGTTDFAVLHKVLRVGKTIERLVMYAFDLMYLDGHDMRKAPLVTRKAALAALLRGSDIPMSQSFEADGAHMFETACAMGLEGIVSKRRTSRYQSDRTNDWVKMTCRQRETLQIVGYALNGNRFDGLYLGRPEGDQLLYVGKVDHGFSRESESDVRKRLTPLVQKTQAFTRKIKKPQAVWVQRHKGRPVTLSDEELTVYAIREAQLILADYIEPGTRRRSSTCLRCWIATTSSKPSIGWRTQPVCV